MRISSCGMRTCFSTCRSVRPGMRASFSRSSSALRSIASRSSPNTFTAISERMPDSMWSSRCEIGWPTLIDSGSTDSRVADVGDDLRLRRDRTASGRPRARWRGCPRHARRARRGRCGGRPTSPPAPARMSRSAIAPTRLDSASEMPGLKLTWMVKVPSLNGGRNERGSWTRGERRGHDQHGRDAENRRGRGRKRAFEACAIGPLEQAHQRRSRARPEPFRLGSR